LLAGTDAIFSPHAVLVGSFLLAPLLTGAIGHAREAAVVGSAAFAVAAVSAAWHHDFGEGPYVIRLVVIAAGGAIATTGAAVRVRAHADLDRMGLLAAVAEVANGTLSLGQTTEQVLDLLVPMLADVAAIEGPRGESTGRLGVRVADSPQREGIEQALMRSGGTSSQLAGAEESRLIPSVSEAELRALAHDEEDIPHLQSLTMKSAMAVPLRARGRDIGTLICAVGGSGRSYDADDLRFAEVLSGRIALALDNAGLSASLSSLERQMAVTLENLAEAVTVQDAVGQTIFANPAAVELLRLSSAEQAVSASRTSPEPA
jgi:GAF domain-containing protein